MQQGGISHQVVSVITPLPTLTCSCWFLREMVIKVSKSQHRGLKTCFLKCLKGSLHVTSQCYSLVLAITLSRKVFIHWLCHSCKSLDEVPVMTYPAQKGSNFGVCLR